MKVQNMCSKNGNSIPNQFIIRNGNVVYFQSYNSIIVKIESGVVYLDKYYWDYSRTTGKYRNIFLQETKKETLEKINSGIYQLSTLN